jgi:hypothetical protein
MSKKVTSAVAVAIDWAKVRRLRNSKVPWKKIADDTGYSEKYLRKEFSVINKISPLIEDKHALDDFKANRPDILAEKGRQCIKAISRDKLEKASAYQLTGMASLFQQMERLERGESTANIHSLTAILDRLDKRDLPPMGG